MNQRAFALKTDIRGLLATSLAHSERHLPASGARVFSLIGLLSGGFGILVLLTAGFLKHPLEPALMFTNFVSSLGWGANGSHEVFKIGLTLLSVTCIAFMLFLVVTLRRDALAHIREEIDELTHHGARSWVIAAIGLLLLAWFVDIRVPDLREALMIVLIHSIGAALFFTFALLGAIKLTTAMTLHGAASNMQHWLLKSAVFNAVAMAVSIVPLVMVSYNAGYLDELFTGSTAFLDAPEQRVDWVKAVTGSYPWISFFEWGAVISLLSWLAVTARQVHRRVVLVSADR